MDKDIITVYLILKSRRELSWEELFEESGLDCERLSRILLLLQLKQRVEKKGEKYVFLDSLEDLEDETGILKCTDYHYERFKNGKKMVSNYVSLSDVLELKVKKSLPLKASFDGKYLDMYFNIDLDKGDGAFEIIHGKNRLSIPHYIDSDSLLFDLYELFQFYKKNADKKGTDFLISKAYGLFHKIANCEIGEKECKLSASDIPNQLEFDAASTCIQICQLVTETLGIDSITTTIDTITRSCQCSTSEIEELKKSAFLKNHEVSTAYTFPLSPFETGTLVMGKGGSPLCLLSGNNLFAKIPTSETQNQLEIDFSHLFEKYSEFVKMNNETNSIDLDRISQLFFSMFKEDTSIFELEEHLNQLKTQEEMNLLNTMYLISYLTIENQTKEVSAKIRDKTLK
ncbi:MAG: hypothetical protein ACETWM_09540 [Candidatus Lokiarchaeia archaeon]